jgi:hypothetical protein
MMMVVHTSQATKRKTAAAVATVTVTVTAAATVMTAVMMRLMAPRREETGKVREPFSLLNRRSLVSSEESRGQSRGVRQKDRVKDKTKCRQTKRKIQDGASQQEHAIVLEGNLQDLQADSV